MKLPNGNRAVVDERKLREYLLSRSHPIGRFKATVFAAAGFDAEDWSELATQLRALAAHGDAELAGRSQYGQKYMISGVLRGSQGATLDVVAVWIVPLPDDAPHLVTVYPK